MVSLALRSFVHSALADDNDCLLANLLHYSFGPSETATPYSKSNALSAQSRDLMYRSLDNLLTDKDESFKYELDGLDEQRLRWLMAMFQPINTFTVLAEGHLPIDQKLIKNPVWRTQCEHSWWNIFQNVLFLIFLTIGNALQQLLCVHQ